MSIFLRFFRAIVLQLLLHPLIVHSRCLTGYVEDSLYTLPNIELETFYVDANQSIELQEIAGIAHEAPNSVQVLHFNNNKGIKDLPVEVYMVFPKLKIFLAAFCSLKMLSKTHLMRLKKLQYINLSDNQIQRIHSDTFEDTANLIDLNLSNNQIYEVSCGVFKTLTQLKAINLSMNNIYFLQPDAFIANVNLEKIELKKCSLKHLDKITFSHLTKLRHLNLENNTCINQYFGEKIYSTGFEIGSSCEN